MLLFMTLEDKCDESVNDIFERLALRKLGNLLTSNCRILGKRL